MILNENNIQLKKKHKSGWRTKAEQPLQHIKERSYLQLVLVYREKEGKGRFVFHFSPCPCSGPSLTHFQPSPHLDYGLFLLFILNSKQPLLSFYDWILQYTSFIPFVLLYYSPHIFIFNCSFFFSSFFPRLQFFLFFFTVVPSFSFLPFLFFSFWFSRQNGERL
jgi:hypothetical protein